MVQTIPSWNLVYRTSCEVSRGLQPKYLPTVTYSKVLLPSKMSAFTYVGEAQNHIECWNLKCLGVVKLLLGN